MRAGIAGRRCTTFRRRSKRMLRWRAKSSAFWNIVNGFGLGSLSVPLPLGGTFKTGLPSPQSQLILLCLTRETVSTANGVFGAVSGRSGLDDEDQIAAIKIKLSSESSAIPVKDLEPSVPAEASPEQTESVKLRAALMTALKEHIAHAHLSQSQAAKVFGVTQPRISDLTRGKVDLFGLDALVNMAATAGLRVEIYVRNAGVADK
jgi:predicted XRE-type DNA-binding protein